jgi:DNA adenine methylase
MIDMRYFGGKGRVGKQIAQIINAKLNSRPFVSLFTGAGWVEQYIEGDKTLCDAHIYLIEMYKALQNGYELPSSISREEYIHIKNNMDEDKAISGFVGFACSHSGKFFRGYASDKSGRNYALNGKNSMLKKQQNGLLNSVFVNCDYREMLDVKGHVIYCDPPYKNTEPLDYKVKYKGQDFNTKFNHDTFWEDMRFLSEHNLVFISEYEAPSDFICVWEQGVKSDMNAKGGGKLSKVERLFVLESRWLNEV